MLLELGLRLVEGLLDPRRVDPAVGEQLLERHPGDLPPDAVEAREHHGAGGVVDDEVDAGEVLQRADVPALAADDAALHVIGGEVDHRYGRLRRVPGGQSLHAHRQDVAHPAVGLPLGLLLDLPEAARGIVARLVLDLLEQQLLGAGAGQAGDPLELADEPLPLGRSVRRAGRTSCASRPATSASRRASAAARSVRSVAASSAPADGCAAVAGVRHGGDALGAGRRSPGPRRARHLSRRRLRSAERSPAAPAAARPPVGSAAPWAAGRAGPEAIVCRVGARIGDRGDDDAHRDQGCGGDDFHGRFLSSRLAERAG